MPNVTRINSADEKKMPRVIALLPGLALLAACNTVVLSPDMTRVKDQPLAYQEGYKAGCNSGYVAGGSIVHSFRRDTQRLREDEVYNAGWKQGYRECKADFREMCRSEAWVDKSHLYCSDVRQQRLDEVK